MGGGVGVEACQKKEEFSAEPPLSLLLVDKTKIAKEYGGPGKTSVRSKPKYEPLLAIDHIQILT